MADWSLMERDWKPNLYDPYQYSYNNFYQDNPQPPCMPSPVPPPMPPPAQNFVSQTPQTLSMMPYQVPSTSRAVAYNPPAPTPPKPDNPREIRNKAEKQRRDKLNQSIGELASMVPPVVAASRKIDKTGVLRLTAHYLRAHQYVFGDSINREESQFSVMSTKALLSLLNGFLLTTTYRGLIVVVSQNVQQYLGYSELDLLGQSVFNIIHEDDRQLMRDMLMPKTHLLGPNGELLVPDETERKRKLTEILSNEKKRFIVRFKKLGQRSEPAQYVTCHIEGTLRKSDRACRGYNRCCQMVRRARARGDNPCNSGNDIVFVGMVRLATDTFISESNMESFRMDYRTRHSIDGQIIQSEHRISLVTGFLKHEVLGFNAMNFMHRDDVRWVVIALREMYDQHRLVGESCYRLMSKTGEFIFMKTRGQLEVDPVTRAVTSFVCTNTVLDENEGTHQIRLMKKKFMLMVNNNDELPQEDDKESSNQTIEDPRQLEKVILHLVTNLPSPQPEEESGSSCASSPDHGSAATGRFAFIPPKKERILSAIEKMYTVINTFPKEQATYESLPISNVDQVDSVYNDANMSQLESQPILPQQISVEYVDNHQPVYSQMFETTSPIMPALSDTYTLEAHNNNVIVDAMDGRTGMTPPMTIVQSANYSGLATIAHGDILDTDTNENGDNNVKYHICAPSIDDKEIINGNHDSKLMTALGTSSVTGVKRPRERTETYDVNYASKKKNAISNETKDENQINFETPILDSLFDEELFNISPSQIDTDINTLEQNIDTTFPDLLISQEVQDILQEIENDHTTADNGETKQY